MAKESPVVSPPPVDQEAGAPVVEAGDVRQGGTSPRFVKIRFPDTRSRVEGVHQLMRRTRVVCLAGEEFVIARAGLSILEGSDIAYEVLEETNLGETLAAL